MSDEFSLIGVQSNNITTEAVELIQISGRAPLFVVLASGIDPSLYFRTARGMVTEDFRPVVGSGYATPIETKHTHSETFNSMRLHAVAGALTKTIVDPEDPFSSIDDEAYLKESLTRGVDLVLGEHSTVENNRLISAGQIVVLALIQPTKDSNGEIIPEFGERLKIFLEGKYETKFDVGQSDLIQTHKSGTWRRQVFYAKN